MTLFLLVLLAMIASGIAWASWARIEEVARAEGRVVPTGRARSVESLEGGIVRAINVQEGAFVTAGQSLVVIDDTGSSASLGELNAKRAALTAQAIRLNAEANNADALDFSASEIDPSSPQAQRESALFETRRASYRGQRAVLESQIRQREQEITELEATLPQIDQSLALLDEEIELRSSSGVVSRAQLLPLERERSAARRERDSFASQLERARTALDEAQARLVELDLTRQTEISTERSAALNELAVVEESIKRARDVVDRADLRAPVDGVVSLLNVNTIGSVIAPGEEVLRIVPDDERLQVDARVRPEDIAFVRADLPAKVKLTSFDFTIYGALDGTVVRVGADAEQDEATEEIYFPIVVETSSNELSRAGKTFEIKPGMVAQVDIMTGEHTVLDYLLKPFRKARMEALRER
ncbi:HlyD family type I secretion periplasmic adaptor subunit [Qingshengfaniella alkalisoli]|uniref:Membrane fusion protein (MFP) family protein n=1 Tax=Qingshengfaniella alkalisoli TaxID=2599296 RepID=A0A5B8IAP9_9RHOB|nr:HlyD family type I secretion periplasmic adaptor subunit [Qingshengfaniella alkalisoli]QDY71615.1 HlyD family type I secretion periplasmic adaptor subunit [Qingshengfaniella alkalisoli]